MASVPPIKKTILSRKTFLLSLAGLVGLFIPLANYLNKNKKTNSITGKIMGASHKIGHKLRGQAMPAPTLVTKTEVLIIGSGISGLSAARQLKKNNITNFRILELDKIAGGNSAFGQNAVSSYPWGAHYLPIPNLKDKALLDFLAEHKVITGYENGLPVYNEFYLCHDPEERLYINGHWQEGLIPSFGVPEKELLQIKTFLEKMDSFRHSFGNDGKEAFTIPLAHSSQDPLYISLDQKSFKNYLIENGFTSPYLLWYADYCCRDDYGTTAEETSAWAGIHYFASRKGTAQNATYDDVLTWPNGNGWLSERLQEYCSGHIETGKLAYAINIKETGVQVDVYNTSTHQTERIIADKCILATPQFINDRLLKRNTDKSAFSYAPWMVANLHIKEPFRKTSVPLSWDNVLYKRNSLGYINANHQNLNIHSSDKMLTFYYPLSQQSPVEARKIALEKTHEDWVKDIVSELKFAHPEIEKNILNADVWIWGHGMVRPTPGFIWGSERIEAQKPIDKKLYFAHTDLSGVSIFEEAFYQGIKAADEIINSVALQG